MKPAPLIVRLTPYNEADPFGAPPPHLRRVWTVWAMLAVAWAVTGATTTVGLGVMFLPVLRQMRALALGMTPWQFYAALTEQPAGFFASILCSCLSFAGCALVPAALSPTTDTIRERLRLHESRRWLLHGALGAVGMFGASYLVNGARALAGVNGRGPLGVLRHAFGGVPPELAVLGVIIVGAGAGLGEELFFRGYMQTRLEERWPPWLANLCVAACFGVAHGELWHSTFAFLAGLQLGWLARRSGSILPTMTAHILNNAFWVVSVALLGAEESWYHDHGARSLALGAALCASSVGAITWLTRGPRPIPTLVRFDG